jgi:CTP:molybdopterin cytidylyltransferase MocA
MTTAEPANLQRRPVAAVVLAAGGGSRFDGESHKLLAEFRGRPVVSWALESVCSAGFDTVYITTGAVDLASLIPAGVIQIPVPDWAEGQSRSLQAAVTRAEQDGHGALVIGLGDQPLVPPAAWRSVGASAGAIVTATFDGKRRPPVKLDAAVWPLLPTEGDDGARLLMQTRPELVFEVPCRGNPVDIDTTEDLHKWN